MNANFQFCDYFTKLMCLWIIMTFAISCSKSDFDEEINSTPNTFKVSISKAGEIAVGHIEINHFIQRLPEDRASANARTSDSQNAIPLFGDDREIEKVETVKGDSGDELVQLSV